MNFTGVVVAIKNYPTRNPSVQVRAYHDRELTWAEWQSDLRGEPKIGMSCRVTTLGCVKIAL